MIIILAIFFFFFRNIYLALWKNMLDELRASLRNEDPRMIWLKDQYLFLYYQDDLCMGPLAADAIKVC